MSSSSESSLAEFMLELDKFKLSRDMGLGSTEDLYHDSSIDEQNNERRDDSSDNSWSSQIEITLLKNQRDAYQQQLDEAKRKIQRLVEFAQCPRIEINLTCKKISVTGVKIQGWIWSKPVNSKISPDELRYELDRSNILKEPYTGTLNILLTRQHHHLKLILVAGHINQVLRLN